MEEFDVTIIGAGLAGLHCAHLLGKRGLRVLLVDRKPSLEHKIHTTGIFVRKTLEDFAIPDDCLGPPIRDVTLYSPARRALHLSSRRDEFRIGRMGPLYLRYLADSQAAGVSWSPNTTYLDSSNLDDRRLLVRVESGFSLRSILTRFLIGADGACSRVAGDLQLDQNREWIVGVENVFSGVRIESPPRLFCFLDPRIAPGYIAWIAWDGHEAHVGVGGNPTQFDPAAALEKFQLSVTDIVDLRHAKPVERRGGRIPVGGVLLRIANTRGLLIGDAAGAVSPLTAGGLDPCIRLSTLAAQVVAEFLTSGEEEFLWMYSGELFRARFASRLWARRIISHLQLPIWFECLCAALRLQPLNLIASHLFFGRGSFPDVDWKNHEPAEFDTSFVELKGGAPRVIVRPTQT